MNISIEFGGDLIFLKKIGHVLIPLWSNFEIEFSKQYKSGFKKNRKLDSAMGTRQKHPISRGDLLLVCSAWVSMFGTTPNSFCAILFCFSDAPPTHLRRTSDAPQKHFRRTCVGAQTHMRRSSDAPHKHFRRTCVGAPTHLRSTKLDNELETSDLNGCRTASLMHIHFCV